jgi:CRP/FNR family transcriptional regulator, cyclic AMP receptor protein
MSMSFAAVSAQEAYRADGSSESANRAGNQRNRAPYGFALNQDCRNCRLRSAGYFCQLPPSSLRAIESVKFTTAFPSGALLFVEGQQPKGFFILCKGRVKLTMSSRDGRNLTVRIIEAGETLGMPAALLGKPYETSAETLEPCQVNFVRREELLRLLRLYPDLAVRIATELSSDQQATCEQVRALGLSRSAAEKIARLLLDWSARGQKTEQGIRIYVTLTHEQIAEVVGISRETVTRTLSEFRRRSLIATRGPALFIRDKAALQALAAA